MRSPVFRVRWLLRVYLFNSRESVTFPTQNRNFRFENFSADLVYNTRGAGGPTRHRSARTKTIIFGKMPTAEKEKERMQPRAQI